MDRREGDRGRRVAGGDRRADAVDQRRVSFSYNSASGAHDDNGAAAGGTVTTATALTWATALGTAPIVGTQTIDLDGELLSLAGTATIDVFGFFTGQFIFTVDTSDGQRDGRQRAAA